MSWLFSQALVEAFSQASPQDETSSAPLSVMPTQHKFWRNDKPMEHSRFSRFGLTCAALTDDAGEALLTSFLEASRARTSVSQDAAQDLTESAADSGPKWRGSLARYSPAESKWKTAQCSLLGDSDEYSETWPRWGTTVDGELYLLPQPVLPTFASESGFWPTPVANDAKNSTLPPGAAPRDSVPGALLRGGYATPGMQLNPAWVEWLMGWPIGWTELKPLAMARFQQWLNLHGEQSHE